MSTESDKIMVLFIGSNPRDHDPLDLTAEYNELAAQLESSGFTCQSRWNVAASELPKLLDVYQPAILHFSGHGLDSGRLLFVDEHGQAYPPAPDTLARVFAQHQVRGVVLNACFSRSQAEHIAAHVQVVIGIDGEISDANARKFTAALYQQLGCGRNVEEAFERAELTVALGPDHGPSGLWLLRGPSAPPGEIRLVSPAAPAKAPTVSPSAHRYEHTSAWTQALAPRADDRAWQARDRLREAARRMREEAAALAGKLALELAEFGVHGPDRFDALWELVDLVAGESVGLSPCEAFVLGGALLTHDLAVTVLASPGGRAKLHEHPRWLDTVAQLMRREGLDHRPGTTPPEQVAAEADMLVLRSLHPDKAAELAREFELIADADARESFVRLIGRLAGSRWWPVARLRDEFNKSIGAPRWCPPSWKVDPLRVACLLRAAHAVHVDERRIQRPTLQGEQLQFTASSPFTSEEASSWWQLVDALRTIDGELRSIDALLQDTGRERLVARRVAAVDDLRAIQNHIPIEGWQPVDTRVRIHDIPALIERLGGRALYGNDADAPVRELLQNAADAIRARRAYESRSSSWGRIDVVRGRDDVGPWLEVRDDGVGMSTDLLVGPLLEFGVSYWATGLSCEEFPGLHASGFRSVGEFGIGFFSVFMLGGKVRVTTRWCRAAETWVLEFEQGLRVPPLLREARADEHLVDAGTAVRVWQTHDHSAYDLRPGLFEKCVWLCPALDVDVHVQEVDDVEPTQVIVAGDWLTLPPAELLQRILGTREDLEDALVGSSLGDDDFELGRVLDMLEPIEDVETGEIVGRACLRPPWLRDSGGSVLVTRGLRLGSPNRQLALGVLPGEPSRAARDEGTLSIRTELLQRWYARQEDKIAQTFEGFGSFDLASVMAPVMHEAVTKLPVLWGSRGWTLSELADHQALPPVIILMFPDTFTDMRTTMMGEARREQPLDDLPDHMFMLCAPLSFDFDHPADNNPTLLGLLRSIASAWKTQPIEVVKHSLLTRIADGERHPAFEHEVWGSRLHVLCKPGSERAQLRSALLGFDEFAKRHPMAQPLALARLAAEGKAIHQLVEQKRQQRRKK